MVCAGAVLWTTALVMALQARQPSVLALAGAADPQGADAPLPAIVSGRVVDAVTGRPVAGAVVTAAGTAAVDATAGILTNAGGHFVVRRLHKGSLALTATKGGYVEGTYGQRRPAGSRQLIAIAEGDRLIDLEIRVWRHAVITGTVVDEAGEPVIDARVRAFQRTFVAGRRRYAAAGDAATDDRGVFRIAQLTPGDYIVAVPSTQASVPTEVMDTFFSGAGNDSERALLSREMRAINAAIVPPGSEYAMRAGTIAMPLPPGTATPTSRASGAMMVYPTTFHPAAAVAAQAAVVTLRSGDERGSIDIQLQPARTARISGTLLAPDGMASHVGLRLLPSGGDALVEEIETATAMSDATGGFTFLGVPPGQYVLSVVRVPRPPPDLGDPSRMSVQAGGIRISTSPPPPSGVASAPIPPDATLWAQVALAVGGEDLTNVIVPLAAGPRMSGRVEFDGAEPPPPPSAIAGLRISLDPADGSRGARGLSFETGHPDESGRFLTYGVPPGRYVVNVAGIAFPGWFFKGARYQGRDITDTPIELTADLSGVVLTFTDKPSTLAGIVRTKGTPEPAGLVLAFPVDADSWSSSGANARRLRVARADKSGAYSFPNLPAGDYYVAAVTDDTVDDWWDPALLRVLSRVARQIRLGDGEQRREELETAAIK
jgi:uncharacterized protein (DUF2141 family)